MPQLAAATQAQSRAPQKMLGAILVELGFINSQQLAQLLEAQRQYLARNEPARNAPARISAPPPRAPGAPGAPGAPAPPAARTAPAPREIAASPARQQWLERVLGAATQQGASDVHVRAGSPVKLRKYGVLADFTPDPLPPQEAEAVLVPAMSTEQRKQFYEDGQVDFTYAVPAVGRFRVNIYQQSTGPCAVFHFIPAEPPLLSDLGLPNIAAKLINHANGIVLITGPAGSGKTSTMAALINLMNEERTDHILSIEDPIEYLHTSKGCIVNQRQVSRDTRSFANALKSALREDPDVICIGELRDLETISLAMSAAETGHLVLGTMHTQGATRTINRVIGAYPAAQQSQVRTMLSESLRAIISQKLILRADGAGMVLAYELMMINVAAANLIRENRTFQLSTVMQMGRSRGMRAMDESLMDLVKRGIVHKRDAALVADDPRPFQG
jgi:twitching motility protein PilT